MSSPPSDLSTLDVLVKRLRGKDGCPWDQAQTLADVRAYLLEEAHEAAAALDVAVEHGDFGPLAEELGDLLFQVAFIARLAAEDGHFTHADAVQGVYEKMVARHPHVFGDETLADADAVRQAWERRKLRSTPDGEQPSLLAGVPDAMPALTGAYRLTQKAAAVGFDWPDADGALAKVREELSEVEAAREATREATQQDDETTREASRAALRAEVGDLLFAVANVARKLEMDPEAALAAGNRKFRRRFAAVEAGLAHRGISLGDASLAEMDALWDAAKRDEATPPASPTPDDEHRDADDGPRAS